MESTEYTPEDLKADLPRHTVDVKNRSHGTPLLNELALELEAVDAISSFLTPYILQVSIHIKRAGILIERITALTHDSRSLVTVLLDKNHINSEEAPRIEKIWQTITSVSAYGGDPEESQPLLSEDDITSMVHILKKAERSLRAEYGPKGIKGLFVRAPSILLLIFAPVLFYAVGFVYTKNLNPFSWFKTGLEDFSVQSVKQEWGTLLVNKSVTGQPLQIAGRRYAIGYGTHANSRIQMSLNKSAAFFSGSCGVDDGNKQAGSIICIVEVNGKEVFKSELMRGKMRAAQFRVPLEGANRIDLVVTDGGDGRDHDHADWVDLKLE